MKWQRTFQFLELAKPRTTFYNYLRLPDEGKIRADLLKPETADIISLYKPVPQTKRV